MIEDRDWQKIGYGTNRLKVPGGWFIMLYTGGAAKSAFFYPDPNHEWDGNAVKEASDIVEAPTFKLPIPQTAEASAEPSTDSQPVETKSVGS